MIRNAEIRRHCQIFCIFICSVYANERVMNKQATLSSSVMVQVLFGQ